MEKRLQEYLNRQLGRLIQGINRKEKTKVRRLAKLWEACRLMHQRAKSDPERKFWKMYLERLEQRAQEIKIEAQRYANRQVLGLSDAEYQAMVDDPIRKKVLS